jgi:hypothetical protein
MPTNLTRDPPSLRYLEPLGSERVEHLMQRVAAELTRHGKDMAGRCATVATSAADGGMMDRRRQREVARHDAAEQAIHRSWSKRP